MQTYRLNDLKITIDKQGANRYTKASYPVRYGRFCEIKSPQYLFQYNLNGEIKTIRGLNSNWTHPAEWLKRTDANDWVFYSVGRYHRLFSLSMKTEELHRIIGGPVSVLPPDTRHVDYEVIPLMVADGCLYHCDFCCVKSPRSFQQRSEANIRRQIRRLKTFYGPNLGNYNALFLGNHDALAAGWDLIGMSAVEAYEAFDFEAAWIDFTARAPFTCLL